METAFREQMKKRCDMMTELSVRLEKKPGKPGKLESTSAFRYCAFRAAEV